MSQRLHIAALPVLLLLLVQILLQVRVGWPIFDGILIDTDSYMRMVRMTELADTGNWYDRIIDRSNAPFGEALHWTRALDTLILAPALVLSPFMAFDNAIFLSAIFSGPILHLATLLALLWAAEFVLPASGRVYVGIIFVAQIFLSQVFALGRVDHHGLLVLIAAILLGLGLKLLGRSASERTALLAGVVAGLGMWIGIEGLIGVAMIVGLLWVAWIRKPGEYARYGFVFTGTLTTMTVLAIVSEHPPDLWFTVQYDVLSIVHLFVFALITIFWALISRPALSCKWQLRVLATLAFMCISFALLWIIYPKFFAGPLAKVDAQVMELWFSRNQEVMAIIDFSRPLYSLHRALLFVGTAVLAVPFICYIVFKGDALERRHWTFSGICMIGALVLAFWQVRWTAYAQLFAILPIAGLLLTILDQVNKYLSGILRAVGRACTVLVFAIGPPILSLLLHPAAGMAHKASPSEKCDIRTLAQFLGQNYRDGDPRVILSHNSFGPELLYRTRHHVVSTPYHRNGSGILDAMAFFDATDDRSARLIAQNRGIDLLIICPGKAEMNYYRRKDDSMTLYQNLLRSPPNWLRPISVSDEAMTGFLMFEVNAK